MRTLFAIAVLGLLFSAAPPPAFAGSASCFLQADGETHQGTCELEPGAKPGITFLEFGGSHLFFRRERGVSVVREIFEADGRDAVRGTKKGAGPCWIGEDFKLCVR